MATYIAEQQPRPVTMDNRDDEDSVWGGCATAIGIPNNITNRRKLYLYFLQNRHGVKYKEAQRRRHCICRQINDAQRAMVFCVTCHTWYHFECVGFKNTPNKQFTEYRCRRCTDHETSTMSSDSTNLSWPSPSEPTSPYSCGDVAGISEFDYGSYPKTSTPKPHGDIDSSTIVPAMSTFRAFSPIVAEYSNCENNSSLMVDSKTDIAASPSDFVQKSPWMYSLNHKSAVSQDDSETDSSSHQRLTESRYFAIYHSSYTAAPPNAVTPDMLPARASPIGSQANYSSENNSLPSLADSPHLATPDQDQVYSASTASDMSPARASSIGLQANYSSGNNSLPSLADSPHLATPDQDQVYSASTASDMSPARASSIGSQTNYSSRNNSLPSLADSPHLATPDQDQVYSASTASDMSPARASSIGLQANYSSGNNSLPSLADSPHLATPDQDQVYSASTASDMSPARASSIGLQANYSSGNNSLPSLADSSHLATPDQDQVYSESTASDMSVDRASSICSLNSSLFRSSSPPSLTGSLHLAPHSNTCATPSISSQSSDIKINKQREKPDETSRRHVIHIKYKTWKKFLCVKEDKMTRDYTNQFAGAYRNVNAYCALTFKHKYFRKDRFYPGTSYLTVNARCKAPGCCTYIFKVKKPPKKSKQLTIVVRRRGTYNHKRGAVVKRHVMGKLRPVIANQLKKKTTLEFQTEKFASMTPVEIKAGNITGPQSKDVLRKIKSEVELSGNLHTDILQEVKILLHCYRSIVNGGFIQHYSVSPFKVSLHKATPFLHYQQVQLGPRYEGQLNHMAEPIPHVVRPLVRTHVYHPYHSADRQAETDS